MPLFSALNVAMPESVKSRKVTALSRSSPRWPTCTSSTSLIAVSNGFNSGSTREGKAGSARATCFLLVIKAQPLCQQLIRCLLVLSQILQTPRILQEHQKVSEKAHCLVHCAYDLKLSPCKV